MMIHDTDFLVDTAQLAAVIILENGGETFRSEETAVRICKAGGICDPEAIAFPTGIFLTVNRAQTHCVTAVKRIRSRSTNLFKVERTNAYSRDFESGKITLSELNEKLTKLKTAIIYKKPLLALAAGVCSAMFSLLFEETLGITVIFDISVTFICAFIAQLICLSVKLKNIYQFTVNFLGSFVIAALAVAATHFAGIGNLGCIIIGSTTPLLPGLSLTNSIRDTVMGDIVSGTARLTETLLCAIAIAGGVGIVLSGYVNIFGGVI